ncbi:hypothetical protein J6590_092252 [Homalodisca vitripennis]|nr:hypothetical protein J6590_092252 [Homalodisca vitripennis]
MAAKTNTKGLLQKHNENVEDDYVPWGGARAQDWATLNRQLRECFRSVVTCEVGRGCAEGKVDVDVKSRTTGRHEMGGEGGSPCHRTSPVNEDGGDSVSQSTSSARFISVRSGDRMLMHSLCRTSLFVSGRISIVLNLVG